MFVGIFGTGRNGSSLITRLLDGIPNAYVHPVEINFLAAMDDLANRFGRISKATRFYAKTRPLRYIERPISKNRLCRFYQIQVDQIISNYWSKLEEPFPLEKDFCLTKLLSKDSYYAHEFIEEFLLGTANWIMQKRPELVVFKSIEVPYIEDYESMFPNMKLIHLSRNPLKVYESLIRSTRVPDNPVKMPSWYLAGDNLNTIISKRWIPHTKTIIENSGNPNHYFVRFEDLTSHPTETIKSICKWLNVELPSNPDLATTLGGRSMKRLPDNVGMPGVKTPKEVTDSFSHRNEDKYLFESEINLISYLTNNLASKLSYPQSGNTPSRKKLLASWILPMRWEFKYSMSYWLQKRGFFKEKQSDETRYLKLIHYKSVLGILNGIYAIIYRRILLLKCLFGNQK